MAGFVLRRVLSRAVLVVLAGSLAYLLAAAVLDPRAAFEGRTPRPPEAVVDARLSALNLNDRTPVQDRYVVWVRGVLHGDFGRTQEGEPVNAELWRRLGGSLRLLVPGGVLGGALGILVGAYAAAKRGRVPDRLVTGGACLLLAVPVFVLAVLLQAAAVTVNDVLGVRVFVWVGEGEPRNFADQARHLLLPMATIALAQLALYSRYQRGLMLDVLRADFVRTARAKGLSQRSALLRHGLRAAFVPMTTYFAYASGLLILGGVFTEKVFGRHGMGEWLVDSIARGDVNVVAAIDCVAACVVVLSGLVSDVLNAALDPRVRSEGAA
ncbi:ABC transporter permease [Actinomadura sp. NAK00032]|uniref:ABC transporter permease n=1 Tax=Actinomadura sp. NAK00032 TaxID=2742128 RepID=UPI001590B833|nr:ABC transporter permease [Actinomadura sp. NAK00032]QKW34912.1 ABC transporter permease [Actinomadura sp. NAK00032]